MITSAAEYLPPMEPDLGVSVAVAAEKLSARLRIARVIAEQPDLRLAASLPVTALLDHDPRYDLLVFDCDVMQVQQATLLTRLRDARPDTRIVAVCGSMAGRATRRAIDGAVDGLVLRNHVETALAPTTAAVLAGQTAFPRDLRAALRKVALSHREKQVLGLVVKGLTNSEIGSRLFLAESTVKSHLSSAFAKLDVRSRSEAAALILDPHDSVGLEILSAVGDGDAPRT